MLTKRHDPPPLSELLRKLLLDGPHRHGLSYHDLPPHDELRRLWALHGPELCKRKRRPWFLDRDAMIRVLRRESRCADG